MPPFNFLLSFVRSFGTTNSPIEDSDDEAGESMSLSDTTSDASLLEILEAKADVSVSPAARVPTSPTIDYEYPHSPPISPCAIPLDKLTLDEPTIPVTGHYCVRRRVKSTARHCVYSVPSREQRVVFKRHCRRKEMFLEDYCNPVASSESSTLSSAPGPVHATSDTGATAIQKNWFGLCPTPTPPIYATKKSHLTIKIPGLVDRLALRLLSSCNVMEPAEEDLTSTAHSTDILHQNHPLTVTTSVYETYLCIHQVLIVYLAASFAAMPPRRTTSHRNLSAKDSG
ncbi:hypothetical protein B0F90DRAFT_1817056 [Multifurca ochricompacta]|uniref:Uncharacterized protein n=1 Tax=Multifurca ochricompacta TaxID=376703 RepID=A0AAD4QNW3_9AGAM|nr:hypothetical protein B0F90DRAFT_1817056 [Multifurca ochricompacta]